MIHIKVPKFTNTHVFNEEGRRWFETRQYTEATPKTQPWYEYWREQKRRCLEGYEVGGVRITGYHYFYLNFGVMMRHDPESIIALDQFEDAEDLIDAAGADEVEGMPDFYDYDWIFFNNIERAEKMGKHMAVLKARRKGYSYKVGSMLVRNYCMIRKSKGYAMAYEGEYLTKDGLLTKTWDIMGHVDKYTAFAQPRIVDQKQGMHVVSGMYEQRNGVDVPIGYQSEIIGISMKDDPNKARGKAGKLGVYEEAGRFPNLTQAWEINSPSYRKGMYTVGLQILFGTGGAKDVDFEGLEKMFYDPDTYNLLAFENIWDEGAIGQQCGFFVPAYVHFEGCIDAHGNSDTEKAKAFQQQERDIKEEAKDIEALGQHKREFPWTPREALSVAGKNIFPTEQLQQQLDRVQASHMYNQMACGYIDSSGDRLKFSITTDKKPILQFPISDSKQDLDGCVQILEGPIRDQYNNVPDNQYIIIHDPYAIDTPRGEAPRLSLGAAYVIKLPSVESPQLNGCIVASYVGRPQFVDTYNEQLFALADYYNAKIGFENNRGKVKDYAKANKKLHRLFTDIDIIEKREKLKKGWTSTITFGIHLNNDLKARAQLYLREWLLTPVKVTDDGTIKRRLHYILDPALLQELIKYNPDGNFDRVSALLIGMFYIEEVKNRNSTAPPPDHQERLDQFFLHADHFM